MLNIWMDVENIEVIERRETKRRMSIDKVIIWLSRVEESEECTVIHNGYQIYFYGVVSNCETAFYS